MVQNRVLIHSFQELDDILTQYAVQPWSLNPHKTLATSFVELANLIVETTADPKLITSLRDTLEKILGAMLYNFPHNLFWDFDFMVNSILKQAIAAKDNAVFFLESCGNKMVSLMDLFGRQSEICFRYIHDFIYGFDWAKWVQQETQSRALVEPFSLTFLNCLLIRGQEILQFIRNGDRRYHKLTEKTYRNPFSFSREPECEHRLLTCLAEKQLIPVTTWDWNAYPVWNKPFHQIREQLSLELHIPHNDA